MAITPSCSTKSSIVHRAMRFQRRMPLRVFEWMTPGCDRKLVGSIKAVRTGKHQLYHNISTFHWIFEWMKLIELIENWCMTHRTDFTIRCRLSGIWSARLKSDEYAHFALKKNVNMSARIDWQRLSGPHNGSETRSESKTGDNRKRLRRWGCGSA
jgi:hypothetical protein